MKITSIEHGTPEYELEVALRMKVLREPLGLLFSVEELKAEASDMHFGAFHEDRLVGCLLLRPHAPGVAKMRQVAVDTQLQGQGVGKKLVTHAEQAARNEGFHEIILHARDTAVNFYLAQDYEVYDSPFEEVGIPHRKMRKTLK